MLRFLLRPRWILFHLLCLGGVVLMVNLSVWQWHRLQERRDFNSVVQSRQDEEPVPFATLVPQDADGSVAAHVEWRPVEARGTYAQGETLLVVNRSQDGRAGMNVVTPLVLDDGRLLLVARGFIGLGDTVPPTPTGEVRVLGRVRASEERRFGQVDITPADDGSGALEVPRLDVPSLASALDESLAPVWLSVAGDSAGRPITDPPDDPSLVALALPELSEGPHLSYAIQWLIFSTAVVIGWVLAVRRSIRTHRQGLAAAGTETPGGPPVREPAGG